MFRITILTLLVIFLSIYSWKDWFRGALALVVMMAVIQHPDMPKSIFGVPGFNLWNVLFLNVCCSWFLNRKKMSSNWDLPQFATNSLLIYFLVIVIGVFRLLYDQSGAISLGDVLLGYGAVTHTYAISELLINATKWVVVGLVIFDGARNEGNKNLAIAAICFFSLFLAVLVIKAMGLGSLAVSGESLQRKALKVLPSNVGYHRVNLSMILAGAFWAVFFLKEKATKKQFFFLIIPACLVIFIAQATTGGRMGYVTWATIGGFLALFMWRKYLLLAPFAVLAIILLIPSAIDRLTMGFDEEKESRIEDVDRSQLTITSGRVLVWPLVIDAILDRPFVGHGRLAMRNSTGITQYMVETYGIGETFPHPHNAYLELVLDNGLIGSIPIFIFFYILMKISVSLMFDRTNTNNVVIGGVCFSLMSAFLIASLGSQTFYPREGSVVMWASIGLMLRAYVDQKQGQSL